MVAVIIFMIILGIETSCDETSLAVLEISKSKINLKALTISSQVKLHARWGGVVPELAARRHAENIIPLLQETLTQAKIKPTQIDLITTTQGPGLITALQVGVETAKTLSATWKKPILGVNHIAGHLVSPFLSKDHWLLSNKKTTWPAIALVVSGGHTEIYLMKSINKWKLLGKTLDDAAGEAFDKVAKMLNLPYPGGPQVAKLAAQGDAKYFDLPRPLLKKLGFDFSFSGLKTAVLYTLQKYKPSAISHQLKANICASFQQTAIDVLIGKTLKAAAEFKARTIIVSGGVSANQELRQQFQRIVKEKIPQANLLFPDLKFTGDNAAMIALAGAVQTNFQVPKKLINNWQHMQANANWELWN